MKKNRFLMLLLPLHWLCAASSAQAQLASDQTSRLIVKFRGVSVTASGVTVKQTPAPGAVSHRRTIIVNGAATTDGSSSGAPTTGGSGGASADTTAAQGIPARTPATPAAPADPATAGATPVVETVFTRTEADAAVAALVTRSDVPMQVVREASGAALVVSLPVELDLEEARSVATKLMADPDVEYAVPDVRLRAHLTNDTYNGSQWNLTTPGTAGGSLGGMNVTGVWSTTQGKTGQNQPIVVSVIDTGSTSHPDLDGMWTGGYDFVSADAGTSPATFVGANDSDGRDASPADPGDWCGSSNSSWHGTAVGGIIAAIGGNAYGIIGVAPQTQLLPVRALGRCGGYLSDIVDAMRWSAGLPVPGVPNNPKPARVINLSLGTDYNYSCSTYEQAAIDEITAAKVLLVAAAGNEGATPAYPQAGGAMGAPANCNGVLAVAAHTRSGDLASYSNFQARVGLTAPGGGTCKSQALGCQGQGIYTTTNTGTNGPAAAGFTGGFAGTSAATPHAAAAAALLFALKPAATPQEVINALKSAARPWPAGTFCAGTAGQGVCGAGMLDVQAAAQYLTGAPQVTVTTPPANLPGGSQVSIDAQATSATYAASQLSYAWVQVGEQTATLTNATTRTVGVQLPTHRSTVNLLLTVTDPGGFATRLNVVVDVNNAPVPNPMTPVKVPIGQPVNVQLLAQDADGDPVRYTLLQGTSGMAVGLQSGVLSWTPATEGSYPVRVAISDTYGATGEDIVLQLEVTKATPAADAAGGAGGGGGGAFGWIEALGLLALLGWGRRRAGALATRGAGPR